MAAKDWEKLSASVRALESAAEDLPSAGRMPFLDVKIQLLLNYLLNLLQYCDWRGSSASASSSGEEAMDPVLAKELYRLRLIMNKQKPIEAKLKYAIDKLVAAPVGGSDSRRESAAPGALCQSILAGEEDASEGRPSALEADSSEGGALGSGADASGAFGASGIYRPPKITSVEYTPAYDSAVSKAQKKVEREEKRFENSQFFDVLRETVGGVGPNSRAMEVYGDGTLGDGVVSTRKTENRELDALLEKQKERIRYEEENLTRLRRTKQDKKDAKKLKDLQMRKSGGGGVALGDLLRDVEGNFGAGKLKSLKEARGEVGRFKDATGMPSQAKKGGAKKGGGKKRR